MRSFVVRSGVSAAGRFSSTQTFRAAGIWIFLYKLLGGDLNEIAWNCHFQILKSRAPWYLLVNEISGGWSWWKDRCSKFKITCAPIFQTKFLGWRSWRSIFKIWNHVRPDILYEISGGWSWWKDRISKFEVTCALIFWTKFLGGRSWWNDRL